MVPTVLIVLATGACASDAPCGDLTLELGEPVAGYPAKAAIGCDVPKGGWWDKVKNEAGIKVVSADLPADAYIVAVLPLSMVKAGAMFSVPTGISGEAYTGADQKNHANLTAGTATIVKDLGTDSADKAHVFQVQWDLTWLGTGTYHSQSTSAVWFKATGAL